MPPYLANSLGILAGILLVCTVLQSYQRLRIGVDFEDEAYYAVLAQRFALGDQPFIDEVNLRQFFALMTAPFYRIYLEWTGSTDGVIYFLRQLYFALQLAVSWAVFRLARSYVAISSSLLLAAIPVAFMPFEIPAPSYNTLSSSFLVLGTCFGLRGIARPARSKLLILSGVFHALASLAYPPFLVCLLASAAAVWFSLHSRRAALTYAGGAGIALLIPFLLLLPNLIAGLGSALTYESVFTRPRDLEKVREIFETLIFLAPGSPVFFLAIAGFSFLAKKSAAARRALLPMMILPVVLWFRTPSLEFFPFALPHTLTMHVILYVGIYGGLTFIVTPWHAHSKPLLFFGWLPSLLAGLVVAYSSDNPTCMSSGLGLFSAALAAPLNALIEFDRPPLAAVVPRVAAFFTLMAIPLTMVLLNSETTYFSGFAQNQTAAVRVGPFQGLYATPRTAAIAESLVEIRRYHEPGERLLVYHDFPAAYLAVAARPALNTAWTDARADIPPLLPYYNSHRTGRGLAIAFHHTLARTRHLEELIETPDRLLYDAGWYRIYREPPPE